MVSTDKTLDFGISAVAMETSKKGKVENAPNFKIYRRMRSDVFLCIDC